MTTKTQTYTPAQANRALPLVRSIVADILDQARELRALADLAADPESDPDVAAGQEEIESLLGEIAKLGLEFKDPEFQNGLVDFPAVIDGRPVLLCWRGDEPSVTHYHGLEEGFAQRKPIPAELIRGEG